MKLTLCAVITFAATSAFAADLRNNDSKAYKFTLVDGSVSSSRNISAGGSLYGLCNPSSKCKIVLNGTSSPEFDNNSKLKIENGKVVLQ